jgi:hypothetical protein
MHTCVSSPHSASLTFLLPPTFNGRSSTGVVVDFHRIERDTMHATYSQTSSSLFLLHPTRRQFHRLIMFTHMIAMIFFHFIAVLSLPGPSEALPILSVVGTDLPLLVSDPGSHTHRTILHTTRVQSSSFSSSLHHDQHEFAQQRRSLYRTMITD